MSCSAELSMKKNFFLRAFSYYKVLIFDSYVDSKPDSVFVMRLFFKSR